MFANNLLHHLQHFALAPISELTVSFVEGEPESLTHLIAHVGANLAQTPGRIEEEVKAHGLRDVLATSPGANIQIADGCKPEQTEAMHPGLLEYFSICALLRRLALVNSALGQGKDGTLRSRFGAPRDGIRVDDVGLDDGNLPRSANVPENNSASRRFIHRHLRRGRVSTLGGASEFIR